MSYKVWYVIIGGKKVEIDADVARKYGCEPGDKTPFTGLRILVGSSKMFPKD